MFRTIIVYFGRTTVSVSNISVRVSGIWVKMCRSVSYIFVLNIYSVSNITVRGSCILVKRLRSVTVNLY